jgi:hypothetical protein
MSSVSEVKAHRYRWENYGGPSNFLVDPDTGRTIARISTLTRIEAFVEATGEWSIHASAEEAAHWIAERV